MPHSQPAPLFYDLDCAVLVTVEKDIPRLTYISPLQGALSNVGFSYALEQGLSQCLSTEGLLG